MAVVHARERFAVPRPDSNSQVPADRRGGGLGIDLRFAPEAASGLARAVSRGQRSTQNVSTAPHPQHGDDERESQCGDPTHGPLS